MGAYWVSTAITNTTRCPAIISLSGVNYISCGLVIALSGIGAAGKEEGARVSMLQARADR